MRIAALILAAGRSTRMGANKLLEVLHDKPLIRHVVDTARASQVSDRVVVTGHEREKIESVLSDGEWGNPVLIMRAAFSELAKLEGDAGARKFLLAHRAKVLEVPVEDTAILIDLDTPEALARARMDAP